MKRSLGRVTTNGQRFRALFTPIVASLVLTGCSNFGSALNPFYETPPPEAFLGDKNDHALAGDKSRAETARDALEQMATYQRANAPRPANPVLQPAVVRLMWIPDHLNRYGDLVPAHYYYLKVLSDRWAVQDAFELEAQLGDQKPTSSIPYVPAR